MNITKALIVADPWIGYLLDGSKNWEMRSSKSSHRGWFGLIRKGTGAVYGVARLVDVGDPLTPSEMIANFHHHRIPDRMIHSGEVAKWNVPWKLADVQLLKRPVPYQHKSGAVTWVELDDRCVANIAQQLGTAVPESKYSLDKAGTAEKVDTDDVHVNVRQRGNTIYINVKWDDGRPEPAPVTSPQPTSPPAAKSLPSSPLPPSTASAGGRMIGEVSLTEGNVANNHIYLRSFFDRFPADAIGGSNKASAAKRDITVDWGGGEPIQTDLDSAKKIFRARGWIGAFFKMNRATAGDRIVVEETAPYRYRVRLQK